MDGIPDSELLNKIKIGNASVHVKYMNVVSVTLLFYDLLLTLDLEVALIWSKKWNTVMAVFLLSRYSAFIDLPLVLVYSLRSNNSLQLCRVINAITCWLTALGVACTEAILVVRTYGLAGRNKRFLIYLIVQFTVICIAVLVILGLSVRTLTYSELPVPTVHGCYLSGGSPLLFLAFILLLLHEVIVMIITLVIGFRKYRNHRTPLIRTLYRDGTLFFVLLFLVSLANIVNLAAGAEEYLDLFTTFQRVMHSVLATRILLNVREAAQKDAIEIALSDMNFGGSTSGGTTTGASSNPEHQSKSITDFNKTQTVISTKTSRSITSMRNAQSLSTESETQTQNVSSTNDDHGRNSAQRTDLFSITEETREVDS